MKPLSHLQATAALLGLFLCACGGGTGSAQGTASPGVEFVTSEGESLFDRMESAPRDQAFHGTRRVQLQLDRSGVLRSGSLLEDVSTDADGGFSVVVQEVESPPMSRHDRDAFIQLMRERQAFVFRFRDFRVRDAQLFLENYEVYELPDERVVAGRTCLQFDVQKHFEPDCRFTIAVDPDTALVLAYTETTLDGEFLSAMEYQTFSLGEDPAHPLVPTDVEAVELDPESAETVLGFELLEPRVLPANYRRESLERLETDAGAFARLVYTDGLATVLMLHRPDREDGLTRIDAPGDRITITRIGTWTTVDGEVRGHRVVVMGTAPEADILQLLQSAVE